MSTPIEQNERLLQKYKKGRDLDDADYRQMKELALIGLVRFGISFRRKAITAKTVGMGLRLVPK